MNDQFLHDLRRAPTPAFARRLRASLDAAAHRDAADNDDGAQEQPSRRRRPQRWLPIAASLVLVSAAFTFPGVRAGAQAFLDLFRITSVVGVPLEQQSLRALATSGLDFATLLGEPVELMMASSGPVTVGTTAEAAEFAGIAVLEPAWRPVGLELDSAQVVPEESARFTADTGNLELVLDVLGIDDLTVPESLDGQSVTLRIAPIVLLHYGDASGRQVEFFQSRSPEIGMPADIDLPVLAEIALRIVGVDRERAFELAWSIDWRSTLIVPVPASEAEFEEVNVAGSRGLMVRPKYGSESVLLWADDDRVYGMAGTVAADALLEMAQTVQ